MSGESYTIVKGFYKVFMGDATGDPMDEMSEDQLNAWLRARGYPNSCSTQNV